MNIGDLLLVNESDTPTVVRHTSNRIIRSPRGDVGKDRHACKSCGNILQQKMLENTSVCLSIAILKSKRPKIGWSLRHLMRFRN